MPGATVERAPCTLGHTRIVASDLKLKRRLLEANLQVRPLSTFMLQKETRSFKGMTWWISVGTYANGEVN